MEIDPEKDVDGFHPQSIGRLALGIPGFIPATPKGILMLLQHYKLDITGMHAVIIGRSSIVGMPMSLLLSRNSNPGNCTVTLCHSRTKDLKSFFILILLLLCFGDALVIAVIVVVVVEFTACV